MTLGQPSQHPTEDPTMCFWDSSHPPEHRLAQCRGPHHGAGTFWWKPLYGLYLCFSVQLPLCRPASLLCITSAPVPHHALPVGFLAPVEMALCYGTMSRREHLDYFLNWMILQRQNPGLSLVVPNP